MTILRKEDVKKKAEFTLGVYPPVLNKIIPAHFCDVDIPTHVMAVLVKEMEEGAMGARREIIAHVDLLCQVIGYGLTFRVNNGQVEFAVYKRNKKNNEKQLSSVFSLGIGGHAEAIPDFVDYMVNEGDVGFNSSLRHTSILNLMDTTDLSFRREAIEEIYLSQGGEDITAASVETAIPVGFVRDSKDEMGYVGNHHFGIVYVMEAPSDASFEMTEENNEAVAWVQWEQLEKIHLLRAAKSEQPHISVPTGDIIKEFAVDLSILEEQLDPSMEQFLEHDFEPWSKYIIHNLGPLVNRIMMRS